MEWRMVRPQRGPALSDTTSSSAYAFVLTLTSRAQTQAKTSLGPQPISIWLSLPIFGEQNASLPLLFPASTVLTVFQG
eukprot:9321665-Pyramimonas_sp.AAC.1